MEILRYISNIDVASWSMNFQMDLSSLPGLESFENDELTNLRLVSPA